jgi:xylulokinase
VTFSLRDGLELLCRLQTSCARIRVSGGGARSAFWRQVMADVFGAEIAEVNVTEGAAFGAALLAGVGASVFPSVKAACTATVRETSSTLPGADRQAYAGYYERYRALYPALKSEFQAMAGVLRGGPAKG